jgi:AraC-like DNA-binding protein
VLFILSIFKEMISHFLRSLFNLRADSQLPHNHLAVRHDPCLFDILTAQKMQSQAVPNKMAYQKPRLRVLSNLYFSPVVLYGPGSQRHWATKRIREYLLSRRGRLGVNLNDIVQELHLGISASQVNRLFGRDMGIGIREYSRRARLLYAGYRLQATSIPIKQIAADAGYRSVQHFTRAFKAVAHTTPAEFRIKDLEYEPLTIKTPLWSNS